MRRPGAIAAIERWVAGPDATLPHPLHRETIGGPQVSPAQRPDEYYRETVEAHLELLKHLLPGVSEGREDSARRALIVAEILRGSGEDFGFETVTRGAELVCLARPETLPSRLTGFVELLREVVEGGSGFGSGSQAWLLHAASPSPEGSEDERHELEGERDVDAAWERAERMLRIGPADLASRIAERLGCSVADVSHPSDAAARLVPLSLIEAGPLLPMGEDGLRFVAASANPTSLALIGALERVTGRHAVLEVCPPKDLRNAVGKLLASFPRATAPETHAEGPPPTPGSVLIVDDDPSTLQLVARLLENEGFAAIEADHGRKALELLDGGAEAELVILDLHMPEVDGREVLRTIRESGSSIPVLILTGERDREIEAQLIEDGADDYLRKPIPPSDFDGQGERPAEAKPWSRRLVGLMKRTGDRAVDHPSCAIE